MKNKEVTLSFCITCKNRLDQIKKTLPQNLLDNYNQQRLVEFVLVDFGSTDGLQDWIFENFLVEIKNEYLKYYYTEELKNWHASIAKNTAHMLATKDIVTNLDCDNFTGESGGSFIMDIFVKYGLHQILFHQFSNNFKDGSYGRISLSKKNFINIGGYDENFEPMGYQDVDLIIRLMISGLSNIHVNDLRYNRAIINSKEEGLQNVKTNSKWNEMNFINFQKSKKNILSGKIIANQDKEYIGITDNIFTFEL